MGGRRNKYAILLDIAKFLTVSIIPFCIIINISSKTEYSGKV